MKKLYLILTFLLIFIYGKSQTQEKKLGINPCKTYFYPFYDKINLSGIGDYKITQTVSSSPNITINQSNTNIETFLYWNASIYKIFESNKIGFQINNEQFSIPNDTTTFFLLNNIWYNGSPSLDDWISIKTEIYKPIINTSFTYVSTIKFTYDYFLSLSCEVNQQVTAQNSINMSKGFIGKKGFKTKLEVLKSNLETDDYFKTEVTNNEYISDNGNNNITISPNPVKNVLYIAQIVEPAYISIYNITGGKIYSNNCNSKELNIDISSCNSGVYILNITSQNQSKTIKFCKE